MTRSFESRIAKLEIKRRIRDDDLSRLSEEELDRRIEVLVKQFAAEYGGIENAITAFRADPSPESKRCADGLEEWKTQHEQVQA